MRTRTIVGLAFLLVCLFGVLIYPIPLLLIYNSPPCGALNFIQVNSTVVGVLEVDDGYNIVVDADLRFDERWLGLGDKAEIDNRDELDIMVGLDAHSGAEPRYAGTSSKSTISTISNQTIHWTGNVTVPHQGYYSVFVLVLYDKKNRIIGTTERICGGNIQYILMDGDNYIVMNDGGLDSPDYCAYATALRLLDDPSMNDTERIEYLVKYEMCQKRPITKNGQQTIPWNIEYINATEAWKISKGSGVQIAIIDTGIDYDHPELKNRVVYGISFVDSTAGSTIPIDYKDSDGHGTLVAGIIAAEDNQIGVVGVAPYSELYAVKVMDNRHSGKVEDLIRGIDWAIKGPDGIEGNDDDADIIHLSLSLDSPSSELENIINYAVQSNSVVVASSGNFDVSVEYPAAYDPVIAVATVDDHGEMYSLSAGPQMDVSAPGVNITSTYLDRSYETFSGGSLAAPHVSGVIALMLSKNHNLTPSDVRTILADSADDIPPLGYDYRSGYGKVNALKALETMVKEVNRYQG